LRSTPFYIYDLDACRIEIKVGLRQTWFHCSNIYSKSYILSQFQRRNA